MIHGMHEGTSHIVTPHVIGCRQYSAGNGLVRPPRPHYRVEPPTAVDSPSDRLRGVPHKPATGVPW